MYIGGVGSDTPDFDVFVGWYCYMQEEVRRITV